MRNIRTSFDVKYVRKTHADMFCRTARRSGKNVYVKHPTESMTAGAHAHTHTPIVTDW